MGSSEESVSIKLLASSREELLKLPKEEIVAEILKIRDYISCLEVKLKAKEEEKSDSAATEERLRAQQIEATRRENVLVMRLTTKEQEVLDYLNQLEELRSSASISYRNTMLDPAVNIMFEKMRNELTQTKEKSDSLRQEWDACRFSADSTAGKKLMAKCRMLHQENEELGKLISSGRIAKLEGDIALSKTFIDTLKGGERENEELVVEMDTELEGMTSTVVSLQQQLNSEKAENDRLRLQIQGFSLSPTNALASATFQTTGQGYAPLAHKLEQSTIDHTIFNNCKEPSSVGPRRSSPSIIEKPNFMTASSPSIPHQHPNMLYSQHQAEYKSSLPSSKISTPPTPTMSPNPAGLGRSNAVAREETNLKVTADDPDKNAIDPSQDYEVGDPSSDSGRERDDRTTSGVSPGDPTGSDSIFMVAVNEAASSTNDRKTTVGVGNFSIASITDPTGGSSMVNNPLQQQPTGASSSTNPNCIRIGSGTSLSVLLADSVPMAPTPVSQQHPVAPGGLHSNQVSGGSTPTEDRWLRHAAVDSSCSGLGLRDIPEDCNPAVSSVNSLIAPVEALPGEGNLTVREPNPDSPVSEPHDPDVSNDGSSLRSRQFLPPNHPHHRHHGAHLKNVVGYGSPVGARARHGDAIPPSKVLPEVVSNDIGLIDPCTADRNATNSGDAVGSVARSGFGGTIAASSGSASNEVTSSTISSHSMSPEEPIPPTSRISYRPPVSSEILTNNSNNSGAQFKQMGALSRYRNFLSSSTAPSGGGVSGGNLASSGAPQSKKARLMMSYEAEMLDEDSRRQNLALSSNMLAPTVVTAPSVVVKADPEVLAGSSNMVNHGGNFHIAGKTEEDLKPQVSTSTYVPHAPINILDPQDSSTTDCLLEDDGNIFEKTAATLSVDRGQRNGANCVIRTNQQTNSNSALRSESAAIENNLTDGLSAASDIKPRSVANCSQPTEHARQAIVSRPSSRTSNPGGSTAAGSKRTTSLRHDDQQFGHNSSGSQSPELGGMGTGALSMAGKMENGPYSTSRPIDRTRQAYPDLTRNDTASTTADLAGTPSAVAAAAVSVTPRSTCHTRRSSTLDGAHHGTAISLPATPTEISNGLRTSR